MSSATVIEGFTQETFDALLQSRQEPDWMRRRRKSAWEQFQALPMPSPADEQWRRTDTRGLKLDAFVPLAYSKQVADGLEPLPKLAGDAAGELIHSDGRLVRERLDTQWSDRGVLFGSLERFISAGEPLLESHLLTRAVDPHCDKLAALHAAFLCGGTLLYVPRGVVVEQPLVSVARLSTAGTADLGHTLVVLEDGASATLFDQSDSAPEAGSGLHAGAVEIFVGRSAQLRYVSLQDWGGQVWNFSRQRALVQQDGLVHWTVAALGSRLSKVNQEVVLDGPGASAEIGGVMFTDGRQHLAYHTHQHHRAPATQSNLLYKGALTDRSRTVWRGMIRVDPDAQKTDAYQRNDNLLLSDDARADSIPGLEIEADDVRCTHGATAGRVDEEQLFYAMSRGLDHAEALNMIVEGFFSTVCDRIGSAPLRDALTGAVARKIGWVRTE